MRVLAPGGGFILSPVDNVREPSEHSMDMLASSSDQGGRARTGTNSRTGGERVDGRRETG